MKFLYYLLLLVSCFVSDSLYAKSKISDQFEIYVKSRFKYQLCYPSFMIPQGESDNGDGQVLSAKDGASISAFGSYSLSAINNNDLVKDTAQELEWILGKHGRVTYRVSYRQWAVISGYDKMGQIFYIKAIAGDDGQSMYAILTYPVTQRFVYDPLSNKISNCFKAIK